MILLVIYVLLIALNLLIRDKKWSFYSLLIYMFILFGWSEGTADWRIYVDRYINYIDNSSITEPIYTLLMRLGNTIGLEWSMMLIIISAISLILISSTILKLSNNPGAALALYTIFTFPMDISQIRFCVAFSIVVFGFRFLYEYNKTRKKTELIKWIVAVLIASGVHLVCITMLILILACNLKTKRIILITTIVDILLVFFSSMRGKVFDLIRVVMGDGKFDIVYAQAQRYDIDTIVRVWYRTFFIFIGFILVYLYIKYVLPKGVIVNIKESEKQKFLDIDTALKCNVIALVAIGLIAVTTDFYRIQQVIVMANYIVYSNYLTKASTKYRIRKSNLIIVSIGLIFAFGALYNLVLNSTNYQTVFLPIFENNTFFNIF